ncbi:36495_t:CDS:1 [Racocetra persica]|uniref:36495_t:CDS:1 n=1 Tax=Racocetra persica TaxID=160502 RepID=A0ACA9LPX0_9GLOM|nr:36495_t:CDS:1 [Racocetra persica]
MKDAYKNRIQQSSKKQSSDLSFNKLALSSQKQLESPRSSQDITEVEVSDTPASVVDEFTFWPRVRNLVLNRLISFNVGYKSSAIEEFGLNSAENQDLNDKPPDIYSEDNNFSESSTEFGENSGNNNIFEDYLASDFDSEMPPEPDNLFTNDRFM